MGACKRLKLPSGFPVLTPGQLTIAAIKNKKAILQKNPTFFIQEA